MTSVRPAAVAGAFYPGDPHELDATVQDHLSRAGAPTHPVPKAIIAPHAGFIYSGPVAASAYVLVRPARESIGRVVLLGPSHRVPLRGLAASTADAFATPLGNVAIDRRALDSICSMPQVEVSDAAHRQEHSLEVQLPFLQVVLGRFSLVPLAVGDASPEDVAEVMERLWGGPETLIVISTDLSHFLDYDQARRMDDDTRGAIEALEPGRIKREQACGRASVGGLLTAAGRRGMKVVTLDMRNSGDTAGSRDRVVGYGSWAFFDVDDGEGGRNADSEKEGGGDLATKTGSMLERHGLTLLHLAAASIEHGLDRGGALPVDVRDQAPDLQAHGASFVTLKRQGRLRGCIGSYQAKRPLAADVAENAYAAAFRDPRFPALGKKEMEGLQLSISVLAPPAPMSFAGEADLVDQLRPRIDGLIIEDKGHRALFLPSVWESLPRPETFLKHLKAKSGMAEDHFSDGFRAWRFTAEEIAAKDLDDPGSIWSRSKNDTKER